MNSEYEFLELYQSLNVEEVISHLISFVPFIFPKMLWEKCVNNSMYVDLLKDVTYPIRNRRIYREKNNAVSISLRIHGNELYKRNRFDDAWSKYNESVCFAENDSECLALAYSNRSQCFLKLEVYDRCIVDIQLAKDHKYPENSLRKLEVRQRTCEDRLHSQIQQELFEPTLSFKPNDKFPNMASVLEIECNETFGRLMKAKCDINIGETLLIEEDFIRNVDSDFKNLCSYCGKKNQNFIPCYKCADATFCNKNCADNSKHKFECEMVLGSDNICDKQSLTTILRSLMIGISTFRIINEMMEFIENCQSTNPFEISQSIATPESKYRTFFKLTSFPTIQRVSQFRKRAFYIYESIMISTEHGHKFATVATKRFLQHLIIHHGLILNSNSFGFEEDGARIEELSLLTSYINHSCLPNVAKLTKGNLSVVKSILPIKKDEQLFVTYVDGEVFDMTEKKRNDSLENIYGFRCKCRLCTNGRLWTNDLFDDPSFFYVSSNVLNEDFVKQNLQEIIQRCIEFLLRYPNMSGSKEIAYIADILTASFSKQLNG